MRLTNRTVKTIVSVRLQSRLVLGFLIATCLTGLVATVVGIRTINKNTLDEVRRKVQQDIHTAQLIYTHNLERLASQMQFIALRTPISADIVVAGRAPLPELGGLIRSAAIQTNTHMGLDMLTVVDATGTILSCIANPQARGDSLRDDPVVRRCLEEMTPQSSTVIMPLTDILRENPRLGERVAIPIVKTPQAVEIAAKQLSEGMVMRCAHPILDAEARLQGALVGGVLLNRDYAIVDKIKETVYYNERYKGHDMGFATVFQGGVRISTNVMSGENRRAIGTIVSQEVYRQVIEEGRDWIGRAFVVNDWYISSYIPIYDIEGSIIGMLYTGILEAKYRDMQQHTLWIFLGITSLGMVLAFLISFFMGNTIIRRIRVLKRATEAIASGNLDFQLPSGSSSGFDILDDAFNTMARSLKERDDRLQKAFQQLTRTERLAALGQMAAGVAHEINNPLGGILLYSNLVLEELPDEHPARENMAKIIYQTDRCKMIVQNLLDFARTPSGEKVPLSINEVILSSLNLVKDQAIFLGVELDLRLEEDLPPVMGDRSRLEEVFLNLFTNAAHAMEGRHKRLTLTTRKSSTGVVKISIADTGRGIDKSYLPHIFEPFFTTKEPGRGTGLGLSITYGIIRNHNGFIDVFSEPEGGTTFFITLPVHLGQNDEEQGVFET